MGGCGREGKGTDGEVRPVREGQGVIFVWETINIMEAYVFFAPGTEKELGIGLVSYQAEVHHRAVRGGYFAPRLFKFI